MRILIVDDEPSVRESLSRTLRFEGYDVDLAPDGAEALGQVRRDPPDAIILDMNMPVLGGLDTCRVLRADGNNVPILMLTAQAEIEDRVAGLDAGADDYLAKPFALQELLARVRAMLRRPTRQNADEPARPGSPGQRLQFLDVMLNVDTREVERAGGSLRLTRTEFQILETFLRNPRIVLTRAVLFERVWGYDFGPTSNSLDVYIGYLRRKLEQGGGSRILHTVRGVGYALREEPL